MQLKDILQLKGSEVVSFLPDTVVSAAASMLSSQSIGAAVVGDPENGVLGVISERDIARGVGDHGSKIADMYVKDLMTRDIIIADLDWDVSHALDVMLSHNIRHLPVIDDELDLVGLVSMRDIAAMSDNESN